MQQESLKPHLLKLMLTQNRSNLFPVMALLGLLVVAYSNIFLATYQFDDFHIIISDPRVQSLAAWWHAQPSVRPLFKLSIALNQQVQLGLDGLLSINWLIHALNSILVFGLVLRALQICVSINRYTLALLSAGVFALHPAQTEAVTYISGRSVSLSSLFVLLGIYCAVTLPRPRWAIFLTVACFVSAIAVRETALVAPALLFLYYRFAQGQAISASNRTLSISAFALSLMLVLFALMPDYRYLLSVALEWRGDVFELINQQAQAHLYLLKLFLGLVPPNSDPALLLAPLNSLMSAVALLVVLTFLLSAVALRRRYPIYAFCVFWFFVCLLPSHSFLQRLDVVNDRHLYFAMPGLALLAALAAAKLFARLSLKPAVQIALCIGLLAPLTIATWQRNRVHQSETSFWLDVTDKSPWNARAHNNLGVAYADKGDFGFAAQSFERALALRPDYNQAQVNLLLVTTGQWDLPETPTQQ